MSTKIPNPTVPMKTLRRLAPRAVRVVARHREAYPVIAHVAGTVVPAAEAFVAGYDRVIRAEPEGEARLAAGRDAVEHLRGRVRAWMGMLERDLPRVPYAADATVPDDVMAEAGRLLDAVGEQDASSLPYASDLVADVGGALDAARAAWGPAQASLASEQELRGEVRALANTLNDELIALRQTLRVTLGRHHRDYQKLRTARARTTDEDDATTLDVTDAPAETFEPAEPVSAFPAEDSDVIDTRRIA